MAASTATATYSAGTSQSFATPRSTYSLPSKSEFAYLEAQGLAIEGSLPAIALQYDACVRTWAGSNHHPRRNNSHRSSLYDKAILLRQDEGVSAYAFLMTLSKCSGRKLHLRS